MKTDQEMTKSILVDDKIYEIRGVKVMLDKDLAELYEVQTRRLREQVKRNIKRFPDDFMFQLSENELNLMVSQNATPSKKYFGGSLPYVFTENGIAMLSSVLKSDISINVNIQIMRTFTKMREFTLNYKDIVLELRDFKEDTNKRLESYEKDTKQNQAYIKKAFELLYKIIEDTEKTDKNLIGFRPNEKI